MAKRLTAIRLSTYTDKQIDVMVERFGMTKTEVIQMAVDRLFQAEIAVIDSKAAPELLIQESEAKDGK